MRMWQPWLAKGAAGVSWSCGLDSASSHQTPAAVSAPCGKTSKFKEAGPGYIDPGAPLSPIVIAILASPDAAMALLVPLGHMRKPAAENHNAGNCHGHWPHTPRTRAERERGHPAQDCPGRKGGLVPAHVRICAHCSQADVDVGLQCAFPAVSYTRLIHEAHT